MKARYAPWPLVWTLILLLLAVNTVNAANTVEFGDQPQNANQSEVLQPVTVASDAAEVTLALVDDGEYGGILRGTLTQPVFDGYATFDDLMVSEGLGTYRLLANGIAESESFRISDR